MVARILWDPVVSRLEIDDLVPRHGPGTTVERLTGNSKYRLTVWHERLEVFLPFLGWALSTLAEDSEEFRKVEFVPPDRELPARVALVPKTLKSPRIIAIEPCCNQYGQQAVRASLYAAIELDRLAAGHVNFRDQTINQRLALSSSVDRSMSTLDLSDASDRVIGSLALTMFDSNPDIQGLIEASRSTMAKLPNGQVIGPLVKFASMGNALTFPVEAMYFYTICVIASLGSVEPVTLASVSKAAREVYVYGDDLIVPTRIASRVVDYLSKYSLKVNTNKSFSKGNFRESCGVDAFWGTDVTPVYLRSILPTSRDQASKIISTVESANQLALAGYSATSEFLYRKVEEVLGGSLPIVSENSSILGRICMPGDRPTIHGMNRKIQQPWVRGWSPSPVDRVDPLDGYAALWKCLLMRNSDPLGFYVRPEDHLKVSQRPGAVTLKRRRVVVTRGHRC
jgi:hypothetical protein